MGFSTPDQLHRHRSKVGGVCALCWPCPWVVGAEARAGSSKHPQKNPVIAAPPLSVHGVQYCLEVAKGGLGSTLEGRSTTLGLGLSLGAASSSSKPPLSFAAVKAFVSGDGSASRSGIGRVSLSQAREAVTGNASEMDRVFEDAILRRERQLAQEVRVEGETHRGETSTPRKIPRDPLHCPWVRLAH